MFKLVAPFSPSVPWQAMHAAPMYIAETAPSQIRGQLISLKEFFIVFGMLVSTTYLPGNSVVYMNVTIEEGDL